MKNFVVFDLDGTLIDTLNGLTKTSNDFLLKYNYPYHYTKEEVKNFIGNGAKKLFLSIIKKTEFDENSEKEYQDFLKLYEKDQYNSEPFLNVIETLKRLKSQDKKLIIYSNKPNHILQKLISSKLSMINFDYIQGQDDNYPPKPDVQLLKLILNKLELVPINGLYVGDSYTDFLTSINIKMDMCFCEYGYAKKEDLDKIICNHITNFAEILNYIK